MFKDFRDADYGHFRIVGDDFHARFAHQGPAHAKQLYVHARLQRLRETCSVHVAGGFTGGEE